jgi:Bacterial Ig-like domain (group 3)/Autotransporter beta-domain/Immunoglobulin I-set domain
MMQIGGAGLCKLRLLLVLCLFTVVAAVGSSSAAFAQAPAITADPANQTVSAGATASFTASSTGTPVPTVQWQVSPDNGVTYFNIAGATATTLSYAALITDNGSLFRAVFTNGLGSATTASATLTVTPIAPAITANPNNLTIGTGTTASFTASSIGAPVPTVQWQVSTDGGASFNNIVAATSTTLSFTGQTSDNGNRYRAVFTSGAGSATTTSATLTVNSIAPAITANPNNLTIGTGTTASFTASSTGAPVPTVQWQVSTDGGASFNNIVAATATTLSFTAQTSDNGNRYRAVFVNGQGAATSTAATLTVNVSVKASATVTIASSLNPSTAGQTVTFTATVTGAAPTGSVTFKDGATTLGTGTLNGSGQATLSTSSLSAGSHAITAVYGGDAGNNTGTSAVLTQTVNTSADSLKLRALQVLVTPMVAQASGQAISSAVDSAINDGFSEDGAFIAPSGNGVRFNFAADPGARVADVPRASDPFSSANGSLADGRRGVGPRSPSSRIDDTFNALAYAGPDKAPPLRETQPREWLGWAEVRGATLDRWGSSLALPGATVLYGNQINLLAGLTRKFTPDFLIGVLGGWETFDYRSDALSGRLKGDGWTVGSYLGWKLTRDVRFDAAVAYSDIGYDGTAGTAAGTFTGKRLLVTSGLTGIYMAYGIQFEPSARVYALWERENAYTDTLGTLQTARDFSTGRASGGIKLSYPIMWTSTASLAPYVGLYGDYYFNTDSASAVIAGALPTAIVLDGWSARAVGGLAAKFSNGAQIAVGGERSGIGGNFGFWTYRARVSVPFGPQ